MVVGLLTIDMRLPGITSLKGKRQVIRSIKDNVRNRFNVSISETDYQDMWQRAQLGVAGVGGDRLYIEKQMARVVKFVESRSEVDIFDCRVEYF